jgi:replicative DNA helicase
MQIAMNVAGQGFAVCYISLEMNADDIGLRAASSLAFDVNNKSWGHAGNPAYLDASRGKLSGQQWAQMHGAARAAARLPIYGTDRPALTLARIEAEVRRAERRAKRDGYELRLVVIDHEGLIAPEGRFPSQLEEARARGNGLLALAKRTGKSVLALSQITKEGARADGDERLPNLNDINYGSALTQAADVVALLHRKAYYAERKPKSARNDADLDALNSKEALIVVDKARGGARKQVAVCIDLPSARLYVAGGPAL